MNGKVASIGDNRALKCLNQYDVKWSFNQGDYLPQNAHLFDSGTVLILVNIQLSNVGDYSCYGRSTLNGRLIIDGNVYLKVLGKLHC